MAVEKHTLSFDPDVWAELNSQAKAAGSTPSAYVNEAVRRRLAIERGLLAMEEWEREHGALTEEGMTEADRTLVEAMAKARRGEPGGVPLR
jgi:hypothetical protein